MDSQSVNPSPEAPISAPVAAKASWVRRMVYGALWGLTGLLILLVALVGFLQLDLGREQARKIIQSVAETQLNGRLEIGKIYGNLLDGFWADDVRILQGRDTVLVAEEVHADYVLTALLTNQLRLTSLRLYRPRFYAKQRSDSSWNVLHLLKPQPKTGKKSSFSIQIDSLHVLEGRGLARFLSDSTATLLSMQVSGQNVYYQAPKVYGNLQNLTLKALLPSRRDTLKIQAKGKFSENQAYLDQFTLNSQYSKVSGRGLVMLPEQGRPNTSDLYVEAQPFAFRDIVAFAPFLNPQETLTTKLRITAPNEAFQVEAKGQFARKGAFDVNALVHIPSQAAMSYEIRGLVSDLDAAYLTLNPLFRSRINAQFEVNATGSRPETLDGKGSIQILPQTSWQNHRIETGTLAATFQNGTVFFKADTGLDQFHFSAQGKARPFDKTPTYDATGQFTDFMPQKWEPSLDFGQFSGSFVAKGAGSHLDNLQAEAQLDLLPSTLKLAPYQAALGQTRLDLKLAPYAGSFKTAANLGQKGKLEAFGHFQFPTDAALTYTVQQAQFRHLDLRQILGRNFAESDLNGRLTAVGIGTVPDQLHLDLKAQLETTRYDVYRLNKGNVVASLDEGLATFDLDSDFGEAGAIKLKGTTRPFLKTPILHVTEGLFEQFNAATVLPNLKIGTQDLKTRLNGRFSFSSTGLDPKNLSLVTETNLIDSQILNYALAAAKGTISFSNQQLRFNLAATSDLGQVRFIGQARPFDNPMQVSLEEGTFKQVNIKAFAADPDLSSDLNGEILSLSAKGNDLKNLVLNTEIKLAPSRFNQENLQSGQLSLHWQNGEGSITAHLQPTGGSIRVAGTGRLEGEEPIYALKGRVQNISPTHWWPKDEGFPPNRLTSSFDLHGRGIDLETATIGGYISARNSLYDQVRVDTLAAHFQYAEGTAALDTLFTNGNVLYLVGKGQLALIDAFTDAESDFSFTGEVKDLKPLENLADLALAGKGRIQGSVRGKANEWQVRMDTPQEGLQLLSFGEVEAGKLQGRITIEFENGQPTFSARTQFENIAVPNYLFENLVGDFTLRDSVLQFRGSFKLDDRLSGKGSGTFTIAQDATFTIALNQAELQLGANPAKQDVWRMQGSSTLTWAENYLATEDLRFEAGQNQWLFAHGAITSDGSETLHLDLNQAHLDTIADLAGLNQFGGTLTTSLAIRGTFEHPSVAGSFSLPDFSSKGQVLGDIKGNLQYEGNRINLNTTLAQTLGDKKLIVKGSLPFNWQGLATSLAGPVDLTVDTAGFNLAWANPFFAEDFLSDMSGQLTCHIQVDGTFDSPNFSGNLQVENAGFKMPFLGTKYEKTEAELRFEGQVAQVKSLLTHSGKGHLKVLPNGTISLSKLNLGYLDLALEPENFLFINDDTFHIAGSGKATLKGTTSRPILDGNIVLNEMEVFLKSELMESAREAVQLSKEDIRRVEAQFGRRATQSDTTTISFYDATDVTLTVRSNGNAWMRSRYNPRMDIEMTGDLEVRKPYRKPEEVYGKLNAVPGRSRVEFGRSFNITTGEIMFNREMLNPLLNIKAEYISGSESRSESQTISMEITGDVENANFRFSSNPAMEDTEILSYLAFGRPAQNAFDLNSSNLVGNLISTYGLNLVESLVSQQAQQIGIADVVEITTTNGQPNLRIGKYLSRRFFVALNSKLQTVATPGLTMEFQAKKWALLRLDGNDNDFGVYVLFEYVY